MKKPNIKVIALDKAQYSVKAPYAMKPIGITIHETDNNATAANEIAYMRRNNSEVSFHFAVDEKEIVQGLPLNRNSWNAGDGAKGKGNRQTIAIEICRNFRTDDLTNYYKARTNAETLVAWLLQEYGWTDKNIYTHNDWSGKNCPRVILKEGYLPTFKKNAMKIKNAKAPVKPAAKTIDQLATEVWAGKHGTGSARKKSLGSNYDAVQKRIQEKYYGKKAAPKLKSSNTIAKEIINSRNYGGWGTGAERRKKLKAAGYDAAAIQKEINRLLS